MENNFINMPSVLRINVSTPRIVEFDQIRVVEFRDSPTEKIVTAKISDPEIGMVTLWSRKDYDLAGDWTQDDANARLIQILVALGGES